MANTVINHRHDLCRYLAPNRILWKSWLLAVGCSIAGYEAVMGKISEELRQSIFDWLTMVLLHICVAENVHTS